MEKYFKNFILCGEIDYYCVMCQETFDDEAGVVKHMRWKKHTNDLKSQEYLHKYKKDFIYKVNDLYYCEVCNIITTDVAGHIKEDSHQNNKGTTEKKSKKTDLVKREPNGTIKVNNKVVFKLWWHGIKDGKCSLCNLDNINKVNHITSASHISNLLQSSIKCEGDNCYRELNYGKFCCFTCFETYENDQLTNHWTEKHSKENDQTTKTRKSTEKIKKNMKMGELIFSSYCRKNYRVNTEDGTVHCIQCNVPVKPSLKGVYSHTNAFHIENDTVVTKFYDHGKRRHELAIYARKNYVKLNARGSKTYCTLCDIFTSAHMTCVKQHVEGSLHRAHLEAKGLFKRNKHEKPRVKALSYRSFETHVYGPYVINEYTILVYGDGLCCMDEVSYCMIRQDYRGKWKCFVCDIMMRFEDLKPHSTNKEHLNKMMKIKVLPLSTKNSGTDIIREVRQGLYHCGCCNKVVPFWEKMAKHLRSHRHLVERAKRQLLCAICAQLLSVPNLDLNEYEPYRRLQRWDGHS